MKAPAVSSSDGRGATEVVATLLLALAAVATAWSSYQATRWNGEQAKAASRASAVRIEAARAASLAEGQTQVDVATFIQWVDASQAGEDALADFYEQRFRPEFGVAFDAWLATAPMTNADAPPTPFAMDEYEPEAAGEAARLDAEAEALTVGVRRDIQRASNYVLAVVLFAVALFFGGMSTKLTGFRLRVIMLAVGCVVYLGTLAWIATFPVSLSV